MTSRVERIAILSTRSPPPHNPESVLRQEFWIPTICGDHLGVMEHLGRFSTEEHYGSLIVSSVLPRGPGCAAHIGLRHKKIPHRLDKIWDET